MGKGCLDAYLFIISFTFGTESGLALVAARDESQAFQILKNSGQRNGCGERYVLVQSRNLGLIQSDAFGLILETYVNSMVAYKAIADKLAEYDMYHELATVARTGNYSDLIGLPHIPEDQVQSDFAEENEDDPGYIRNKPNLSNFITNMVDDLFYYYKKSDTYTRTEIQQLISAIQQFHFEVYESLSDIASPASNVLYLIGPTGSGEDKYEEYIYTDGQFVKIGDTSIPLSDYVTVTELNEALSAYTTTSELDALLAKKQNIHTATSSPSEVTNPVEGDICHVDEYVENIKPSSPAHIEELDVSEYSSCKIRLTKLSDFYGELTVIKSDSTTDSLTNIDLPVTYDEGVVVKLSAPYFGAIDRTGVFAVSSADFEYVNGSWEKRGNYVKLTNQTLTEAQKKQARVNIDVESSDNTQRRIYKHISQISDPKEGDISCYGYVFLASNLQSVSGHTNVPTNPDDKEPASFTDKEYFRIRSAVGIPNPQSSAYGPDLAFDEEDDVWYKKVIITVHSESSWGDDYGSETLGTIEAELVEDEDGDYVVLKFTGSDNIPHYIYYGRPYDIPAGFITDQIASSGSLDGEWVNATSVTFTETGNQGDRSLFQYFSVDSLFPGVISEYRSGVWVERKKYQEQADYNQTDIDAPDYIKNKPDLSGFITKTVDDLVYYYKKTETYTQTEVNNLIGAIQQFHYEIYASTSAVTSPATNVLYLIGPTGSGADKYEEYVYANNTFVKIGDTSIDLSGYVTTTALNTALADYTTTADLTTLLAAKYEKPSGGIPSSDMSSAVQTSLGKADSAYQKPSGGIPNSDLADAPVEFTALEVDTIWDSVTEE